MSAPTYSRRPVSAGKAARPVGGIPAHLSPRPLRAAWSRFATTRMWWDLQRAFWVVVILAGICLFVRALGSVHDLAPLSGWEVDH